MKVKPRLSFGQILSMSMGFLGIQMGFALQNANASRILQTYGADVDELSWFWIVAPLTGMIVGILAMFAYNFLVSRIDRVVRQLEARTMEFMDLLNEPV
jgi:phosphate/sulfate permease